MPASKRTMVAVTAGAWLVPGAAFGVATVLSGNVLVGAVAAMVGVVVARVILRWAVSAFANDRVVVGAGEHAVAGRIEAVEVFWRPGCAFAEGIGRSLGNAGVPMHLRNIRESPDDAAIVRSIAGGNETVPTLIIGPVALVNPGVRLVMATLREHAPHLLGTGT